MAAMVLCLVAVAFSASSAQATIDKGGFSLSLSEKEMALDESIDLLTMNYLMKDLSIDRVVGRNTPYLEVQNNADSDAPLTEFRMTIGDERFHFGCEMMGKCASTNETTPGVSLASSVENGGDVLVVQFGNGGLAPGELVRFKIDIGVDSSFVNQFYSSPDYRTVLFDMNGIEVYGNPPGGPGDGTSDNASFWGTFEMAGMPSATTGPQFLEDRAVNGAPGQYYNHLRRPRNVQEPIVSFGFISLDVNGGGVIPEPSSVVLVAASMLGGLALRPRRHAMS